MNATLRSRGDKLQNASAGTGLHHRFELRDGLAQTSRRPTENSISRFGLLAFLGAQPRTAQSDTIDADTQTSIVQHEVRRHVLRDHRQPADHRQLTDANELVNTDVSREHRFASDLHIATQQRAVDDDRFILNLAVVTDVCSGHHEAALTDHRRRSRSRTAMHRHMFAKNCAVADAAVADVAGEGPILRHISHDGTRVNLAVAADFRVAENLHERPDGCARTNADGSVDDTVRPNDRSGVDLCGRVDDRRGMNRHAG